MKKEFTVCGGKGRESENKGKGRRKIWLGSVNLGVRDNRQQPGWCSALSQWEKHEITARRAVIHGPSAVISNTLPHKVPHTVSTHSLGHKTHTSTPTCKHQPIYIKDTHTHTCRELMDCY